MTLSTTPTSEDDILRLSMLHANETLGLTADEAARRFGSSGSAFSGFKRALRNSEQPCLCVKPENKDGGMPSRWWAE